MDIASIVISMPITFLALIRLNAISISNLKMSDSDLRVQIGSVHNPLLCCTFHIAPKSTVSSVPGTLLISVTILPLQSIVHSIAQD